jgi:hypothetical protein
VQKTREARHAVHLTKIVVPRLCSQQCSMPPGENLGDLSLRKSLSELVHLGRW